MDDDTITGAAADQSGVSEPQVINGVAVDDQGQALTLPEDTAEETPAVNDSTTETEQPADDGATESKEALPEEADDKLKSFAKGQGIDDLSSLSQREMSLLKSAYDNKAEQDRMRQQASELEKASKITNEQLPDDATPEQVDNVRIRNLELTMEVQRWKLANPDKLAQEQAMVNVLSDPNKRAMVQEGYLSLDDVYSIAKSTSGSDDDLKSQGKREALETLAHTQQAAVPRGNAVNSVPSNESAITPQNVDALVGQNDLAWFEKNREAINKAMAGQ